MKIFRTPTRRARTRDDPETAPEHGYAPTWIRRQMSADIAAGLAAIAARDATIAAKQGN